MPDDPFADVESLFDQLTTPSGPTETPAADVVDRGDAFEVRVDLPGFDTDAIEVQVTDDSRLQVDAERSTTDVDGEFVTRERRQETVSRTLTLPADVDPGATEASYDDGVLAVHLPRLSDVDDGTTIPVE
jgi:HSP20 family protein